MKTGSNINHSFGEPAADCGGANRSGLLRPVKGVGGKGPPNITVQDARSADLISPAQVTPPHWTVAKTEAKARAQERYRRDLLDRSKQRSGLYPLDQVYNVARQGLGRGYRQTGATRGEWDISGTCETPRPVTMDGAPARLSGGRYVRAQGSGRPLSLILWTRCRRCPPCRDRRRNLWAARARDEVALSTRTWFATLTFAPAAHWLMECRASARLTESGVDLRKLPRAEAFAEVVKEYGEELTKWMKRVRKNSGARLRYIIVAEPHKSGKPHFHALIHEIGTEMPIRHAVLRSAWTLGFTKFKLVERDVKACWYVAKYLSKSVASRVRASLAYGSGGDRQTSAQNVHSGGVPDRPTWPPAPPNNREKNEVRELQNGVSASEASKTNTSERVKTREQSDENDDLHDDIQGYCTARKEAADRRSYFSRTPAGFQSAPRQGEGSGPPQAAPHARAVSQTLQSIEALRAAFGAGRVRYSAQAPSAGYAARRARLAGEAV